MWHNVWLKRHIGVLRHYGISIICSNVGPNRPTTQAIASTVLHLYFFFSYRKEEIKLDQQVTIRPW